MVGHVVRVGTPDAVHAPDMASHRVAKRHQQLAERAIQVEAIPAATIECDARRGRAGINVPDLTGVDPHRLVGHPLHVTAVQSEECVDRGRFGLEAEATQVRRP